MFSKTRPYPIESKAKSDATTEARKDAQLTVWACSHSQSSASVQPTKSHKFDNKRTGPKDDRMGAEIYAKQLDGPTIIKLNCMLNTHKNYR